MSAFDEYYRIFRLYKKYHVIKVKNEFHTLAMPGMIAVDVMELAASTTSYRLFITQEWAMLALKLISEV